MAFTVHNQSIEAAVIVYIPYGETTPNNRRQSLQPCRDVLEMRIGSPQVAKQLHRLAVGLVLINSSDVILNVPIGYQDIQPAVIIGIQELRAECQVGQGSPPDPIRLAFVRKRAVA